MTKEIKKDIIADAALACFLASGYGATSVDEIVKASGVSKGGIYWYFKSKEDIFLYLVKRWINEWNDEYLANVEDIASAQDKLTLYVDQRIARVDTPMSALMLEFLIQTKAKETIHKMTCEFDKPTNVIFQIFSDAIAQGDFKPMDPKILTLSFLAIFDGVGLQLFIHKDKELLEKTLRTSLDIFLAGIRVN